VGVEASVCRAEGVAFDFIQGYHWDNGLSVVEAIRIVTSMSHVALMSDKDGFQPVARVNAQAGGKVVLVCDHASNALPEPYGSLGLPPQDLERHIGWDIGAADVTRRLAEKLDAPAVLSGFSRLLIDPNRGADDPTLVMKLSDGAVIPGNRDADAEEVAHRRAAYWQPYQDAIASTITRVMSGGAAPVILSVHSFTPVWRGVPRPWHAGILWDKDPRLAHALLSGLRLEKGLVVGDNEPYTGRLKGDTMYRNGTQLGLAHAIVEIRQDLIDTHHGAEEWAERLAQIVRQAVEHHPKLNEVRHFGSHTDSEQAEAAE